MGSGTEDAPLAMYGGGARYCVAMSRENVELMCRTIDAFNREGVEAALVYMDPAIEWVGPPEWLEASLYKGHDGIRKIASLWDENFDEYRLDLERALDAGDHVVALVIQRGRIKGSGDQIHQRIGFDWEVRGGKGVRVRVYFSWGEALAVVGLRE
jgi:ketosteroid isomerase-like protein